MRANTPMVRPEAAQAGFAQFAYRDLDKMSWLAPLVNNRIGEMLCLQLRHEHLFFFKDGEVVDEIGYGEDSRRFHERDKGKPMHNAADLTAQGYWLIPPKINARAAFESLEETRDGAYYSVFSNQCQSWARRVRRRALDIESLKKLPSPEPAQGPRRAPKPVKPTVPAAWYLGMLAVVLGILGLAAPAAAGFHYLRFVAVLLLGAGVSDLIYAFTSKMWDTFLSTALFGVLSLAGAAVLWANSQFLIAQSNGVLAVVLAVTGVSRVAVALRSRPLSAWLGTLASGVLLAATAVVAWYHRDGTAGAWLLGASLSISFIGAGISTIWLNWKLRTR